MAFNYAVIKAINEYSGTNSSYRFWAVWKDRDLTCTSQEDTSGKGSDQYP